MRDLGHKTIIHTMRTQRSQQMGQARAITDRFGNQRTIEVGAEADPILTQILDQMVKVSEHDVKLKLRIHPPVRPQKGAGEIDAHHSITVADHAQLAIGQITRMRADGPGTEMRATSSTPFALRCDRSTRIPNRLHSRIRALPASVSPGPVSGSDG